MTTEDPPENPTRQMVIDRLASPYRREAIPLVLETPIAALGGNSPEDLMDAGESRRIYDEANGNGLPDHDGSP